jgi:ABC-type sugar transport system ATPase subunit
MRHVDRYIEKLEIKAPSGEKAISELSGGNQQKVVFARWIEKKYGHIDPGRADARH